MHEDLDDLLAEVADAHLPGYSGASGQANQGAAGEDTAGLTAAQKKRRKKKNKKKEKQQEAAAAAYMSAPANRVMSHEEMVAESKRQCISPLRDKIGASL